MDKSVGLWISGGEGVSGAVIIIVAPQSCKRPIFKSKKTINQINDLQYLVFFANY